MMEFGVIFTESLAAIKKNIIIIAPTVIASLIMLIVTSIVLGSDLATIDEKNFDKTILAIAPRLFAISAFNYFLQVFSHCTTIAMAIDIVNKGTCNFFDSCLTVLTKINTIVPASFLILILLTFGLILLILPALIVCFVFILTFIIIMNEDINPLWAMQKSYRTMKDNFSSSVVMFFFLLSVGITVNIINLLFGQMHYIGVVFSLFLSGVFMAFAALTLLKYYMTIEARRQPVEL
ncbi:MAG: hypothetical protein HQK99_06825 [Nitrospirae bacterium]|nr:hypothetical protein [Nitrospirota bacterium]